MTKHRKNGKEMIENREETKAEGNMRRRDTGLETECEYEDKD